MEQGMANKHSTDVSTTCIEVHSPFVIWAAQLSTCYHFTDLPLSKSPSSREVRYRHAFYQEQWEVEITVHCQWPWKNALTLPFSKDLTKNNKRGSQSGYQRWDISSQMFTEDSAEQETNEQQQPKKTQRDQGTYFVKQIGHKSLVLACPSQIPQPKLIKSQSLSQKEENLIWWTK